MGYGAERFNNAQQWVERIGDDEYRVTGWLGSGHAVAVYAAERVRDGQKAALKFLKDPTWLPRLQEEARILRQWMDMGQHRRVQGLETRSYTPALYGARLDGLSPCIAVERIEGVPLSGITDDLCNEHRMSREWVAIKLGLQFSEVLRDLHGQFRCTYPDLKEDCMRWLWNLQDRRQSHIVVLDWNMLHHLEEGEGQRHLISKNLRELNLLVFRVAVGGTLGGYSIVDRDTLEQAGGDGWKALSYGLQEVLARALSPLEEERYATAEELREAYAGLEEIWDATVDAQAFADILGRLGPLKGDDSVACLQRIAAVHSVGLLAGMSGASEETRRRAIDGLEARRGIEGVRLSFEAGRQDALQLAQDLVRQGRHLLAAKRWERLLAGIPQLPPSDPARGELLKAMDDLGRGEYSTAEYALRHLRAEHKEWDLEALLRECGFAQAMRGGRLLADRGDLAAAQERFRNAQEECLALSDLDPQYARELQRRFGDPASLRQELERQRERTAARESLIQATRATDVDTARRLFLRALDGGMPSADVARAIENWIDELLGVSPPRLDEALRLASVAGEDARLRELQWLYAVTRLLCTMQSVLDTADRTNLEQLVTLLAACAQLAAEPRLARASAEPEPAVCRLARRLRQEAKDHFAAAIPLLDDRALMQLRVRCEVLAPDGCQAVAQEQKRRRERLEGERVAWEREAAQSREAWKRYWEAKSRELALESRPEVIQSYLSHLLSGSPESGTEPVLQRVKESLEASLRRARDAQGLRDIVQSAREDLAQENPDYAGDIRDLEQVLSAALLPDDLRAQAQQLLARAREEQASAGVVRAKRERLARIRRVCQEALSLHGSLDLVGLVDTGLELARELRTLRHGAPDEDADYLARVHARYLAQSATGRADPQTVAQPRPSVPAPPGSTVRIVAEDRQARLARLKRQVLICLACVVAGALAGVLICLRVYWHVPAWIRDPFAAPRPGATTAPLPGYSGGSPGSGRSELHRHFPESPNSGEVTGGILTPATSASLPTVTPVVTSSPTATSAPTATPTVPPTATPHAPAAATLDPAHVVCLSDRGVAAVAERLHIAEEDLLSRRVRYTSVPGWNYRRLYLCVPKPDGSGVKFDTVQLKEDNFAPQAKCEPLDWPPAEGAAIPVAAGLRLPTWVASYYPDATLAGVLAGEALELDRVYQLSGSSWYQYRDETEVLYFRLPE